MDQLVIGLGEVGSALTEVLGCPGRDVEAEKLTGDVLHIAFPHSKNFVELVSEYEREYTASLVVVHSTVPTGTCDANGWVHSPVRGRHPYLADSLKVFPKWFGSVDRKQRREAMALWPYKTKEARSARDTEAAKLWELAQFGLQVRVTQAIYDWCQERGIDPEVVYRQFAEGYNEGYQLLGDDHFTRPVLDYVPGPIGGHCIAQNMPHLDHPITKLVEEGIRDT